ncbi:hypothetical protein DV735_g5511, partial [Chaetothyriales sp. CBS 134920]
MAIEPAPQESSSQMDIAQSAPVVSEASSVSSAKQDDNEPDWKPSRRFLLAMLSLCILTLMVALDATSLSVALPVITHRLHGTAIEAFWSGTSFLLASTVLQPTFASLSHIFGRVPMVLTAITFFLAGVLMAALCNNFSLMLAGRTIQGIGGGGIISLTEILITDLIPLRFRGQWAGLISGMWSLGSVSGPVIGGAFASVGWRWIFWINLPFIGVCFVLIPLFLRLNLVPSSIMSKLKRVDWIGTIIFVGSSVSFLIPLTWGGVMYPWSSWRTLVPLLVGAAGLAAFVLYEKFVAPHPSIPLSIFANRTTNTAFFTTVLHGILLWCLLYYQPLYYEAVKGYKPVIAGVALFPSTFTVAPMAVIAGISITKLNRYRWCIYAGWAVTTLGCGLLILLDVDTTIPQFIFINLVPGVGLGLLFPALQFQLQAASSSKNVAFAVAMFSFFRAFGQTLGVAIGGVIFQNQMTHKLRAYPHYAANASDLARDATALVYIIQGTPAGQDKDDLLKAYNGSIRAIYIFLTACTGLALITCTWIKDSNNVYARTSKLDNLAHLLRQLDSLIFIQLGAAYYHDNLSLLLVLRVLSQVLYVQPKPTGFVVNGLAPSLVVNALCIITHLLHDRPEAVSRYARGWIHGGLLIDFVGELGPVSRWTLLAYDVVIVLLQVVMLMVGQERRRRADRGGGDESAAATAQQDLDAEEAGFRRSIEAAGSADDNDETQDRYGGADRRLPDQPRLRRGGGVSSKAIEDSDLIAVIHVKESLRQLARRPPALSPSTSTDTGERAARARLLLGHLLADRLAVSR